MPFHVVHRLMMIEMYIYVGSINDHSITYLLFQENREVTPM